MMKTTSKGTVTSRYWVRTNTIGEKSRFLGPETRPLRKVRQAAMAIGPHAGAHRVAIRAATSIGVPLIILYFMGRMDLSIYASFGALSSLYGRFHYYGDRIRMQLGAGLIFVSVLLIGTLLAVLDADTNVRIMTIALVATLVDTSGIQVVQLLLSLRRAQWPPCRVIGLTWHKYWW